jgi:hypothetical protein
MKNILLTIAATAALMVGGMTFTDTAEARPRGWGGYYGSYYRPYAGYYRSYPRYTGYRYGYPGYYGRYYGPRYYGPSYYGPSYYGYPRYGSGIYFSTPRAGLYFY